MKIRRTQSAEALFGLLEGKKFRDAIAWGSLHFAMMSDIRKMKLRTGNKIRHKDGSGPKHCRRLYNKWLVKHCVGKNL